MTRRIGLLTSGGGLNAMIGAVALRAASAYGWDAELRICLRHV
jgi:hypothetical protein